MSRTQDLSIPGATGVTNTILGLPWGRHRDVQPSATVFIATAEFINAWRCRYPDRLEERSWAKFTTYIRTAGPSLFS